MSATLPHSPAVGTTALRGRTLKVVRLQFVNRQTFLWVPLMVLGSMLVLTLVVYWIFAAAGAEGPMYSGGSQAPLWYFAVVGAQALNLTFYFSQALSLTRREFYLGSLLAAATSSAGVALVYVLLGLFEQATEGFGINGYFVYLPWIWESGPLAAGAVFFVLTMLFFILGFWFAVLNKRFGMRIVVTIIFTVGLLLLGSAALISLGRAWAEVWTWVLGTEAIVMTAWAAVAAVVFALGSYLSLRRLTT